MKKTTTISKKSLRFGITATLICVIAILTVFFALAIYVASGVCSDMLQSGISYAKNVLSGSDAHSVVADGQVNDEAAYAEVLEQLNNIRYSTGSISHLMVFEPHEHYLKYIFDTDINAMHSYFGDIYEYDGFYNGVKERLFLNEEIPDYMAMHGGGELTVSAFSPVTDANGEIYGYVEMDISISLILDKLMPVLLIALAVVFAAAAVAIAALNRYLKRNIITNIVNIIDYTNDYRARFDGENRSRKPEAPFIKTNDELECLYKSIRAMTESMDEYVDRQKERRWNTEHDQLTTLFNRNKLYDRMERQYLHVNSLFVVALSVNHLKEMNERYSFKSGDSVLIKVAKEMRTIMTENIHAYRVGGDEFVIVMCDYEKDSAESFINDWTKDIGKLNRASDDVSCTLSVGYAYSDGDNIDFDKLLETASRNMLDGK